MTKLFKDCTLEERKKTTTELYRLVSAGDLEGIKSIIDSGYDYLDGLQTAFILSVRSYHKNEAVSYYFFDIKALKDLAMQNPRDYHGIPRFSTGRRSAIDAAAESNHIKLMHKFIDLDPIAVSKSAALWYAAIGLLPKIEMVDLLLANTRIIENTPYTLRALDTVDNALFGDSEEEKNRDYTVRLEIFNKILANMSFETEHTILAIVDAYLDTSDRCYKPEEYIMHSFTRLLQEDRILASLKLEAKNTNSILVKFACAGYSKVVNFLLEIPEVITAFKNDHERIISTVASTPRIVAHSPYSSSIKIELIVNTLEKAVKPQEEITRLSPSLKF